MTSATSIGQEDPPSAPQSGIDDESTARTQDGESVLNDDAGHDVTREDIESGNDQNVSADDLGRSGRTSKDLDAAIELGK